MNKFKLLAITALLSVSQFTFAETVLDETMCTEIRPHVQEIINLQREGVSKEEQLKGPLEYQKETGKSMELIIYIINLVYEELDPIKDRTQRIKTVTEIHEHIYDECIRSVQQQS